MLWVLLWPVVGAVALLGQPRRSAWHLVAAVALLVAVTPAWATVWVAPSVSGERAAGATAPEGGRDEADERPDPSTEPVDDGEPDAGEEPPQEETDPAAAEQEADEGPPSEDASDPADPDDGSGDGGAPDEHTSVSATGDLEVHFLDVGQADATLLLHDEVAVLIDTGHWQRSDVVSYLRAQGVDRLDLVVVTHPHADHIGQFAQVVDAVTVDEVWWSGSETTTQTFERAVDALVRSGARYEEPRTGDTTTIGPLRFEVVNPPSGASLGDLHDASLSFTVTYGEVTLLFTGDAEAATEGRMVSTVGARLRADILQLGHHGSSTSTTPSFLAAVDPSVAIYSAGSGNQYGHPHAEVIDRLVEADVQIYGTDVHGHVMVVTDGAGWSVSAQRSGTITAAPPSGDREARAPPAASGAAESSTEEEEAPDPPAASGCTPGQVDINSAGIDALQDIIHIGPARAEDIVAMRPFADVHALTRVNGIAAARIADIKQEGIACAE